jgi:hypothetical protein
MTPLARLIAIEEIKQLKARYFRLMDTRDWDGMAEVFTRDVEFDASVAMQVSSLGGDARGLPGTIARGRDALMAVIKGMLAEQTSFHHGHCHEIVIDSDTEAHGIIAFEDRLYGPDRRTPNIGGMGHYEERYRVEDGQWRIAYSRITRLFFDMHGGSG